MNKRAALGVLFVAIGAVLLLDNMNLIPSALWWISKWYTLLIAIGVFNLFTNNKSAGVVLIVIGGVFMLSGIGVFNFNWNYVWPIIIIGIGLAFIFRGRLQGSDVISTSDNAFDVVSVFGASKQIVSGKAVQGGRITSIFGGSELDLRSANVAEGASVEVFTMFGGTEIIVPPEWSVNVEVSSIFGGFENKRSPVGASDLPSLRIKGLTIFGGGEVKS